MKLAFRNLFASLCIESWWARRKKSTMALLMLSKLYRRQIQRKDTGKAKQENLVQIVDQ